MPEDIRAFRQYVDEVVAENQSSEEQRVVLDGGTVAYRNGLRFQTAGPCSPDLMDPTDFETTRFWSISTEQIRFAGRVGTLTLVNNEARPATLTRRWVFGAPA